MSSHPYYITTAIDYPNAPPHIGHAYEKIIADLYARWHRLQDRHVFFLTGTDENGQKLQRSAKDAGYTNTQSFVDDHSQHFKDLCRDFNISYSHFIRTTDPLHIRTVEYFWQQLLAKNLIYFGHYEGKYCYACEKFYPENQVHGDNLCPVHLTPLSTLKENGYFFRLSQFQDSLLEHITHHPEFIFPHSARDNILSRLQNDPLQDLSITRKSQGWGICVPNEQEYVIYTWLDALINYFSPIHGKVFPDTIWPPQVHVIGKDITWFHAVIWPAMLQALDLPLPQRIHVHGMVLDHEGHKMSKTRGNIITPHDLAQHFPQDSIRYYFIRAIPSGTDGKLSLEQVRSKHNCELANEWGNLISRLIKLGLKVMPPPLYPASHHPSAEAVTASSLSSLPLSPSKPSFEITKDDLYTQIQQLMASFLHHKALDVIFNTIAGINSDINDQKPWTIKDSTQLHHTLYPFFYRVAVICALLTPFLPHSSAIVWNTLGPKEPTKHGESEPTPISCQQFLTTPILPVFHFKDIHPLFEKIPEPLTDTQQT